MTESPASKKPAAKRSLGNNAIGEFLAGPKGPRANSESAVSGYDYDRPYVGQEALLNYTAKDAVTAARYGKTVKAIQLSNSEYNSRFNRLSNQYNMKPPPDRGRIFSGYLFVRKLGTAEQYETWMPEEAFDDLYRSEPKESSSG